LYTLAGLKLTSVLLAFNPRSSAFIGGRYRVFDFRVRLEEKHIWPPMNADERR